MVREPCYVCVCAQCFLATLSDWSWSISNDHLDVIVCCKIEGVLEGAILFWLILVSPGKESWANYFLWCCILQRKLFSGPFQLRRLLCTQDLSWQLNTACMYVYIHVALHELMALSDGFVWVDVVLVYSPSSQICTCKTCSLWGGSVAIATQPCSITHNL